MLTEKGDWKKSWEKNIDNYLAKPPRTANFINYLLSNVINSILELGAGSCRDSIALSKFGYNVTASDFEQNTIELLKKKLQLSKVSLEVIDTFNISKDDNSVDLIFHNGLFVLFDDNQIKQALIEQARVARKYILILVHNGLNRDLVADYKMKINQNKIYDIRFFSQDELENLIKQSGIPFKEIMFYKFGGFADTFYDKKVKGVKNLFFSISSKLAPMFYRFQSNAKTERIACLIKLN
jgi:ubiquinone/menaquinone biosynthesis C-methylase UbiE